MGFSLSTGTSGWISNIEHQDTSNPEARIPISELKTVENQENFSSVWNTEYTGVGSSADNQISLPLVPEGTYNFVVDWGDRTTSKITSYDQSEVTHTYGVKDYYVLNITGTLIGWQFGAKIPNDSMKIVTISQWGNINLGNRGSYFKNCYNMVQRATDSPDLTGTTTLDHMFYNTPKLLDFGSLDSWNVSGISDLSYMFYYSSFNQSMENWDVSSVLNMSHMFYSADKFDQYIGNWDVSHVEDMSAMFFKAESFNKSINNWNVSSVTNMGSMFSSAYFFNKPIDSWDVSSVTNMDSMFSKTVLFNQPIGSWDVSSVTNMDYMFSSAHAFNQSLLDWDVSRVKSMVKMFEGTQYNQPLGTWDVSHVTDMSGMFSYSVNYNHSLNEWDISSVTNLYEMFRYAQDFNQPLNKWNVTHVTNMRGMFREAISFNQPLDNWDVSNVLEMGEMFQEASSFNQPLNNWNVSSVTYMSSMFEAAISFNQPLDSWDVSNVLEMQDMFHQAIEFEQSVGNWDISKVSFALNMFSGVVLSAANYDLLLLGWSQLQLQPNVVFDAGNSYHSSASSDAKTMIIEEFGWTITDYGSFEWQSSILDTPDDLSFDEGKPEQSLIWSSNYDDASRSPYKYIITLNNSLFRFGNWDGGNIEIGISDLETLTHGEYNFTLHVYDSRDSMDTSSVIVRVIEVVVSSTSSSSTSSPSTSTTSSTRTSDTPLRSASSTSIGPTFIITILSTTFITHVIIRRNCNREVNLKNTP